MTVLYFWRRTREERNRECDSILGAVSHKAKGFVASARISLSPAEDLSESKSRTRKRSRGSKTRRVVCKNPLCSTSKKRTFVYRQRCVFWMMFAFGKWWRLRLMMFASRMMRGFATFGGKHRLIAERSGATSFWAKRKTSCRRKAMLHLVWIYRLTRDLARNG